MACMTEMHANLCRQLSYGSRHSLRCRGNRNAQESWSLQALGQGLSKVSYTWVCVSAMFRLNSKGSWAIAFPVSVPVNHGDHICIQWARRENSLHATHTTLKGAVWADDCPKLVTQ